MKTYFFLIHSQVQVQLAFPQPLEQSIAFRKAIHLLFIGTQSSLLQTSNLAWIVQVSFV
jgi:hypothetical protein